MSEAETFLCSLPSPLNVLLYLLTPQTDIYIMSRVIDSDTAASVKSGSPQQIYKDISEALCCERAELLDIEFLGKSHPLPPGCNLLVDGNSIALPKTKLVQAFVVARQQFFNHFDNSGHQDIQNVTAVILLMDPEHTTAANARKRLIQKSPKSSTLELQKILKQELLWLDSMLTSRLHRHTKSPTLWGHRRWVLEVCQSTGMLHDVLIDLKEVILISAERHPRNYYAWLHMRWLLQTKQPDEVYSELLSTVLEWCLRHPADTSGFSFLLFCLSNLPQSNRWIDARSMICREVLNLANSFQWTHESVWVFLRIVIVSGQVNTEQRENFYKSVDSIHRGQPENSKARKILLAARDWCIDHQEVEK